MRNTQMIQKEPLFVLDQNSVPECQVNTLMDALVLGMKEFFARPEAEAYFEAWKKAKEGGNAQQN